MLLRAEIPEACCALFSCDFPLKGVRLQICCIEDGALCQSIAMCLVVSLLYNQSWLPAGVENDICRIATNDLLLLRLPRKEVASIIIV